MVADSVLFAISKLSKADKPLTYVNSLCCIHSQQTNCGASTRRPSFNSRTD